MTEALASPPDYMDALRKQADQFGQMQMNASVTQALDVNPDKYAEQKKVAGRLGVQPAVVEALPNEMLRRDQMQRIQQDTQDSPVLRLKYTDADFAKLAIDDSSTLAKIEKLVGHATRYVMGAAPGGGIVGDVKAATMTSAAALIGAKRAAVDTLEPLARLVGQGDNFKGLSAYYKARETAFTEGAKEFSPPSTGDVGAGVSSGVQSFAQNAKYIPLALMGPAGMALGLGGMVAETFGTSYNKAADKGLPLWQALSYAGSDAAVEYATEKSPLGILAKGLKVGTPLGQLIRKSMMSEIIGENTATVLQDLNEWAALNPEKSFMDYLKERPSAALQTTIATIVGTGGNIALGKMVDSTLRQVSESYVATAQAEALKGIMDMTAVSKLAVRSPEQFKAAIEEMAPGAVVRFDAEKLSEVLSQSGLPQEEILQKFPSLAEVPATGEVSMPVSELVAGSAGTPLAETLQQHARLGDNELSAFEAQQEVEQRAQLLEQKAEQIIKQAEDEAAMRASHDAVQKQVFDSLQSAGRFTPDVNKAYSQFTAAFYTTMAGREGMTPEQMAQKYPLSVVAQSQGVASYNQVATDTPEFRRWFGESKVVDKTGQPLVVYHGAPDARFVQQDGTFKSHKERLGMRENDPERAFFFASDRKVAATYADDRRAFDYQNAEPGVVATYLSLRNPMVIDHGGKHWHGTRDAVEKAKAAGHDGVVIRNVVDDYNTGKKSKPTDVYVAFSPEQIKSATGNQGTFDPNNPNILKQSERNQDLIDLRKRESVLNSLLECI